MFTVPLEEVVAKIVFLLVLDGVDMYGMDSGSVIDHRNCRARIESDVALPEKTLLYCDPDEKKTKTRSKFSWDGHFVPNSPTGVGRRC